MSSESWAAVREAARGLREDYRQDAQPLATPGGQGIVYKAIHKLTAVEVAIKRLSDFTADGQARMRREVDAATALDGHPNVMPVLDWSEDWFVMPLADGSAEDAAWRLSDTENLRELVSAVCAGLRAAHEAGWVHRDVKPANILCLDGRWVVADWGLGRRPRGETTTDGRTRTGVFIGSERFSAPELADDAHAATFAADVYSIGQVIGWAVTGDVPLPFQPRVPASGPWRAIVKVATQHDPGRRPQTIRELVDIIDDEFSEPAADPITVADALLERAQGADREAAAELWDLAAARPGDYDLYTEVIARIPVDVVSDLAMRDPARTTEVVRAMQDHQDGSFGRSLPFSTANLIVKQMLALARAAADTGDWDLLEDASEAMFTWDGSWDQWNARDAVAAWLVRVDGEAARVIARALRRHPYSIAHFDALAEDRRVDPRLRGVLAS